MNRFFVLLMALWLTTAPVLAQFKPAIPLPANRGGTGLTTSGTDTSKALFSDGSGKFTMQTAGVPANYTGQNTITTLGTISTGVWNGTAISSTYLDAQVAYKNATNIFTLVQTLTAGATPATAGGAGLGTAALPFLDAYIGTAATNNTHVTGTVTAARTLTLPDANSNTVVPDTGAANNFLTGISNAGVITKAQPSFGNISGTATGAQVATATDTTAGVIPALTDGKIIVGKTAANAQAVSPSGDIASISNAGSFAIANSAVTNAKSANMAAHTHKGNNTAGSAAPLDLTQAQLTAELNVATDTLQGMAPATTDGKILVGKTGAALQAVSPSGDIASISNTGAVALKTLGTGAGSCTNCSATFDANGRETAYSSGGTASVAQGGTGATTFNAGFAIAGNGTSALTPRIGFSASPYRRFGQYHSSVIGANTRAVFGEAAPGTLGTAGNSAYTGGYMAVPYLSGSVSGNTAGSNQTAMFQFQTKPVITYVCSLSTTSTIRQWVGLDSGTVTSSDVPGSGIGTSGAMFRYSTSAGDTAWQFCTFNGLNETITTTGVTADTNMHSFTIDATDGSGTIRGYIDGVLVGTGTLTLPGASTSLRGECVITTLTGAGETVNIAGEYWESN